MAYLSDTARAHHVSRMFGRIAGRYDLLNGMISLCQAGRWRRLSAELAAPLSEGLALDIATGTGDLALELARLGSGQVVAVDFSGEMLLRARMKARALGLEGRVTFVLADAHELPFPDQAFSCATVAFGVRNFTSPDVAFAELQRVVKVGGKVVCLELLRPYSGLTAALYRLYLQQVVPRMGHYVSGDEEAYRYLPDSIRAFLTAGQLQELMEGAGLRQVRYQALNLGTIAVHVGYR